MRRADRIYHPTLSRTRNSVVAVVVAISRAVSTMAKWMYRKDAIQHPTAIRTSVPIVGAASVVNQSIRAATVVAIFQNSR